MKLPWLGLGAGWRPELALAIERHEGLGFVEIVAENIPPASTAEACLQRLRARGLAVIPHGISLSLGGAEPIDPRRAARLDALARRYGAPFVSEHIAFVRAGGIEAGHLLPVPRTYETLEILVENILEVKQYLSVPLALENIAALFEWPDSEMSEPDFLREVLERTDSLLLLDLSNLYANTRNMGGDPLELLSLLPLERLAYCHVGGGVEREGTYHDTHGHSVPEEVFRFVEAFCGGHRPPGLLLERDGHYPPVEEWHAELARLAVALNSVQARDVDSLPNGESEEAYAR